MAKKPLTIYFDDKGNMLDQDYSYGGTSKSEIAEDFNDSMKFMRIREYRRKNSRAVLKSETSGREYTMFIDDFNEVLQKNLLIDLTITGTWRFLKRGSGQAIRLVLEDGK